MEKGDSMSRQFQYEIEQVPLFDLGWKGASSFYNIGIRAVILLGKPSKFCYEVNYGERA
jgi:hypothetical protein